MEPNLKNLYQHAVTHPETREIMDYLTARGIDPTSSQKVAPLPAQVADRPMITVNELIYDLTRRAGQEMQMQQKENPAGKLAQASGKMQKLAAPDTLSGVTDMRVLLDIATREQLANKQKRQVPALLQPKKPGTL